MATILTMLSFWFLIYSTLSLGNPLSEIFDNLGLERIIIRPKGDDGPDDMTDYSNSRLSPESSLFLASAGEPRLVSEVDSMPSVGTDSSFELGAADDIFKSSDLIETPVILSDSKLEESIAFHDGDLPEEGWGDCDFPKMPACCEYTIFGVTCIWYASHLGSICPDHPADIWPPRTEAEQARYRAVCCDRIVDQIGIGCVPVHDRYEPSIEEEENMADGLDDFFPVLTEFNAIKFAPIPGACKATQRRDSQTPTQCLPQEQ